MEALFNTLLSPLSYIPVDTYLDSIGLTNCFATTVNIDGAKFRLDKLIAEGGFSFVYKGYSYQDHKIYAVKKIISTISEVSSGVHRNRRNRGVGSEDDGNGRNEEDGRDDGLQCVRRELRIHSKLQHPNILPLLRSAIGTISMASTALQTSTFEDGGQQRLVESFLVFPLCSCSLLEYTLEFWKPRAQETSRFKEHFETFDLTSVLEMYMKICKAVDYLHTRSPAICHRDIKIGNVLLKLDPTTHEQQVFLMDFGSAVENPVISIDSRSKVGLEISCMIFSAQ